MKTVLLTGMSGTGKTTAVLDLESRGHTAVDLDTDAFSRWIDVAGEADPPDNQVRPGQDWVWHEERVRALLSSSDTELLFVSGCASNMVQFYPSFDHIVLLTAPDDVIVQRLESRTGHAYGQSAEEIARVLRLRRTVEPLLRRVADLEVDTSIPGQSTADLVLRHARTGIG